jgi:hypothetical protein
MPAPRARQRLEQGTRAFEIAELLVEDGEVPAHRFTEERVFLPRRAHDIERIEKRLLRVRRLAERKVRSGLVR